MGLLGVVGLVQVLHVPVAPSRRLPGDKQRAGARVQVGSQGNPPNAALQPGRRLQ